MRSKFWGVVLMMGLLLLLAVAGTEASVIIGTGEGGGPARNGSQRAVLPSGHHG